MEAAIISCMKFNHNLTTFNDLHAVKTRSTFGENNKVPIAHEETVNL